MINQFFYRVLLLGAFPLFSVFAQVDSRDLSRETQKRFELVPEFAFIQKEAKKLGVEVYLFGGTASAFAHYVRWDLEREAGDTKYQKERFDYDFTNIYRGNQDLDIVVDGTAEQAAHLRQALEDKYPHFVGDKDAWEVRLLRARIGDKLPLLGNQDFKNQHSDTNSTGLISLSSTHTESIFKDLRDWDNPNSQFLKDVSDARVTYLFSEQHETTTRFQAGLNPPLLSAIRYLAKLTQYEVKGTQEDLTLITKIIAGQKFSKLSSYSKQKAKEFGLKILLNSPNVEMAWGLLEQTGLRKKLIEMDGKRINEADTLSWWMNKEPLKSKPLGEGDGKTAAKIFNYDGISDIIVAHETNSFIAYENITRSSKGEANVFISRQEINGESAVYGNGFYVQIGHQGAAGTKLNTRFKLNPLAKEGTDFTHHAGYLVIKNKNALTLLQENLNISFLEFIKLLEAGNTSPDKNKGLYEKLKRKFDRFNVSQQDIDETNKYISEQFFISDELSEKINLDLSNLRVFTNFDDFIQKYFKQKEIFKAKIILSLEHEPHFWREREDSLRLLINKGEFNEEIIQYVMPTFKINETSIDLINKLISSGIKSQDFILKYILSEKNWIATKHAGVWFKKIFISFKNSSIHYHSTRVFFEQRFISSQWAKRKDAVELFNFLKENAEHKWQVARYVAAKEEWAKYPEVRQFISEGLKTESQLDIIRYVFSQGHYAQYSESEAYIDFLLSYSLTQNSYITEVISNVLSNEEWSKHLKAPEWISLLIKHPTYHRPLIKYVFSKPYWAKHKQFDEWMATLTSPTNLTEYLISDMISYVLTPSFVHLSPELLKFINTLFTKPYLTNTGSDILRTLIYSKSSWATLPDTNKWLKALLKKEDFHAQLLQLFSHEDWQNHQEALNIVQTILSKGKNDADFIRYVLQNTFWQNHPSSNQWITTIIDRIKKDLNKEKLIELNNLFGSQEYWYTHPKSDLWINQFIDITDESIKLHLFAAPSWASSTKAVKTIEYNLEHDDIHAKLRVLTKILTQEHWVKHKKSFSWVKKIVSHYSQTIGREVDVLATEVWSKHPKSFELLELLLSRKDENTSGVLHKFLSLEHWASDSRSVEILFSYIKQGLHPWSIEDILKLPIWQNHPILKKYMDGQSIHYKSVQRQLTILDYETWKQKNTAVLKYNSFSCKSIL